MKQKNIERYIRENISRLCPYSTARDEFSGVADVLLDANESPYTNGFNRYPDPHQKELKDRLSKIKDMPVENIFLGNGSDEAIDLIYRIFCQPGRDNAVIMAPSYGMYSVCADINDVEIRSVQLEEDFSLSEKKILSACDSNTKVIFLCSPNNPSGNIIPMETILDIVDRFEGIVVVDEAYADFSSFGSLRDKVLEYNNLIVLQTLSKAYALAGLRIGMAFACSRIISLMSNVKYPYNISQAALNTVSELLEEDISPKIKEILSEREKLYNYLEGLPFVRKVYASEANFLLVRVDDADDLYNHLLRDGIIVRNRSHIKGCEGCLRITVGLKSENHNLFKSLQSYKSN